MTLLLRVVKSYLATYAILVILLPVAAGLFGVWTGQAMFVPMLQAMYTYFLKYTLLAAGAIALVIVVVSEMVRYFRVTRAQ